MTFSTTYPLSPESKPPNSHSLYKEMKGETKGEHGFFRSEDEFEVLEVYELFAFYNSYFFDGVL